MQVLRVYRGKWKMACTRCRCVTNGREPEGVERPDRVTGCKLTRNFSRMVTQIALSTASPTSTIAIYGNWTILARASPSFSSIASQRERERPANDPSLLPRTALIVSLIRDRGEKISPLEDAEKVFLAGV